MIRKIIFISIFLNLGLITALAQKSDKPQKLREVTIYLLKEIGEDEEYDPENPLWLFPVKRQVSANAPLADALKALVKGATKAEERQGFHSSTFGIRFISVSLKNGQAFARFTMPRSASFSGDMGPSIFKEAVRKTAKQFKEVKNVVVSLNGDTDFDSAY